MKDPNLFRFEVFCSSKQLGDVIIALSGRVVQVSTPQLVVNAKRSAGGVKPMSNGDLVAMFSDWIKENGLKEISTDQARQFLTKQGRSQGSYSYLFKKAREYGLIKHVGKGKTSKWEVLSPKLRLVASKKRSAKKVSS